MRFGFIEGHRCMGPLKVICRAMQVSVSGFLAWREMCAKNPEFDIARLFARGNPQLSPAERDAFVKATQGLGSAT